MSSTNKKKSLPLSKSQYTKAKKCLKAIWLYRHQRELADPVKDFQQNIFDQGTEVGVLAQSYFHDGVLISETYKETEQALISTEKALAENAPAIFEAAFMFDDILIRVDALRNNFDGSWDLIEVKSTNSVVPKAHYDDVALQKYVLLNSGIKINKSYLMHLNRDYKKQGELDIQKLFHLEPLDDEIQSNLEEVPNYIELTRAHLSCSKPNDELIGSKCNSPYVCEFKSHCWKDATPDSVHKIGRINNKKRHELMDLNLTKISETPDDYKWSVNQQIEVTCHKTDDIHLELEKVRNHLDELTYPLYFLDYESVAYAIPRFDVAWPHKHHITQYSLHIQKSPGAPLEHTDYLHNENTNPAESLATKLLKDIPDDGGSIIVYHKTYERDRTKELAEELPKQSKALLGLIDRMWDLEVPFAKRWYWDKDFEGSSSIKKVLPVFAPEFSYKNLEIQNGAFAQLEYSRMIEMSSGTDRENLRAALLKYCERDTLAMVKILESLQSIIKPELMKIGA
jgi:hypothetical protein